MKSKNIGIKSPIDNNVKSKGAISIASSLKPEKILLVVAETAHKKNWEEEFKKWGEGILWFKTTVECYASLKNYRDSEWDLVILDEGHHFKSELRTDVLASLQTERVVVLTATLSKEDEDLLNIVFRTKFYKDIITLQDAISWGILPKPKIYLYPISLGKTRDTETIQEGWGDPAKRINISAPFTNRFHYMKRANYPALNLTLRCTELQKYNYLTEKVDYFKRQFMRTRQEYLKNKWLQTASARKRLLAELKTGVLKELLERLSERRYICFCGSVEQANLLGGENAIHSKKVDSLKTIERFNNKEINHLVAVNMLQEGQNLVDIELGIIAQLDGQERAFIQKFGRTLRADSPIQIIMYFRDTRDEEYLDNALDSINPEYVQELDSLSELIT